MQSARNSGTFDRDARPSGIHVREGCILMGALRQQLSPADGLCRGKSDMVESDPSSEKPDESNPSPESDSKTHWLYRMIF